VGGYRRNAWVVIAEIRTMYEAMIEALELSMEEARAQHAITMVNLEKDMSVAQFNLNKTLRDIAMAAKDLTPMEKKALASAAALYLALSEQVKEQIIDVAQKQYTLDSLVAIKNTKTDKKWDGDAYVAKVDYWKAKIAELEDEIAGYEEAKKNAPQVADLDAWSAELKKYEDAKAQLEYSRAQITKDSASLMVNVHEGPAAYKAAVEDYLDENGLDPTTDLVTDATGTYVPVPVAVHDSSANMRYTTKYTIKDTKGVLGTKNTVYTAPHTFGAGKQGAVTDVKNTMALDVDKLSPAAQAKLASLLSSYKNMTFGTATRTIIDPADKFKITADADMKAFVVGDTTGKPGSQKLYRSNKLVATADFGLRGAYTVLSRKDVLDDKDITDYEAEVTKTHDAWKADRDTLSWVYDYYQIWKEMTTAEQEAAEIPMQKYPPFKDSLAKYVTAAAAWAAAIQDSTDAAKAMVKATKDFVDAFNGRSSNFPDWNTTDSTQFLSAVVEFAKARTAYLGKYADKKVAPFITKDNTPNYLHYASSSAPLKVDSIEFEKLTMEKIRIKEKRPSYYGSNPEAEGYSPYVYQYSDGTIASTDTSVFEVIVSKLVNTTVWDKLSAKSTITANDVNGADAYQAFYGQFKYDASAGAGKEKFVKKDGSAMPEVTKDEREAAEKALENVGKAQEEYEAVYERYWGASYPTLATEMNPTCYSDTSFTVPFPIVMFNGDNVIATKDVLAVLGSVDPVTPKNADGSNFNVGGFVIGSAIFVNDNDFHKYMKAVANKNKVDEQDLAVIDKWITAVEARFDAFKEEETAKAKAAYEYDNAVYEVKAANYETVNNAYTALLGTYKNAAGKDRFYALVTEIAVVNPFGAVDQTSTPVYDATAAKWLLHGKQLEYAETSFPEYAETMGELYERNWKVNDQIAHNQIILDAMKPAYLAAAKAAEYQKYVDAKGNEQTMNTGSWDELITSYEAARKKYVNDLDALIKGIKEGTADENIPAYKKLIADFAMFSDPTVSPDGTEMPYVMMQIAEAQLELESATQKLGAMQQALAYAKANLDRILEYVKSETDASVLLPFLYEIESNEEESISQLSQYGIIINLQSLIDEWFSFESYDEPVDPDFED